MHAEDAQEAGYRGGGRLCGGRRAEYRHGSATVQSGETRAGAARFAAGEGRHGKFQES